MARNRLQGAADKWSSGVQRGGSNWTEGVNSVTVSPTQLALQAKPRMIEGFNRALSDGTYEAGCNRVTAQSWQASCKNKQANYTQAATTKKEKVAAYYRAAAPDIQRIQDAAKQMPGNTLQERIARSAWVQEQMAQLRGKFRQK